MDITQKIQKVALVFFFILGSVHLISYLMILNEFSVNVVRPINKIAEIPFILSAAVYGFMSLKLSLARPEKKHTISNIVFILLMIVLLVFLVYINLFIPDR